MNITELQEILQNVNYGKVTNKTIAKWFNVNETSVSRSKRNNTSLTEGQLLIVREKTGIDLLSHTLSLGESNAYGLRECKIADAVEVPYLEHEKLKTEIVNTKVTSAWLDREIVCDVWGKDPRELRIMQMPGDRMDYPPYSFKRGDVLLIDTNDHDFPNGGIFAFLFDHQEHIGVSTVELRPKGVVEFSFKNPIYKPRVHTKKELEELGFKIVGRVIKNLSFSL